MANPVGRPRNDARLAPKTCEEFRYVPTSGATGNELRPSTCLFVSKHPGMHFDGETYFGTEADLAFEAELLYGNGTATVILGDH